MFRCIWKARIALGKREEYVKRHDEIWPELIEVFQRSGMKNYSIWEREGELIGYYECEKTTEEMQRIHRQSGVTEKWDEFMKDSPRMPLGLPFNQYGFYPHINLWSHRSVVA